MILTNKDKISDNSRPNRSYSTTSSPYPPITIPPKPPKPIEFSAYNTLREDLNRNNLFISRDLEHKLVYISGIKNKKAIDIEELPLKFSDDYSVANFKYNGTTYSYLTHVSLN